MKFGDWTSGSDKIVAAGNTRFYSVGTSAITIGASNTFSDAITLGDDLDLVTPGRQAQITVEVKIPVGSVDGFYLSDYGIKTGIPVMTGTVVISGNTKFGSTLTAVPSLINSGVPSYQWKRNGENIDGATDTTYTLAEIDITKVISVVATAQAGYATGVVTSDGTAIITKADVAAPTAPTFLSKTDTNITLVANALNQFSKDAGANWQDSNIFNGLSRFTEYTFITRVKETSTANASASSTGTAIRTNATIISNATIVGVTAPAAAAIPTSAITDTTEYTAAIAWSDTPITFSANTIYTATITITPKTGYTLTGVSENFFTVAGATSVTNSTDSGIVTAVFPVTGFVVSANYQGGKIAYILVNGDPGYDPGQTDGLIAAASDQSTGIAWYNGSYTVVGSTATAIGTGNANTEAIVSNQGDSGNYAAKLCRDLSLNGYDDWYLPSKDELDKLYLNRVIIGNFTNNYYWSSSEGDSFSAWRLPFDGSGGANGYKDNNSRYVRAIRSFSTGAAIPSAITLAIGSTNPVGGITNVAIPFAGATDTTGAVTNWTAGTADKIKFTVTDVSPAVSTITIGGTAYVSGNNYTIGSTSSLTIIVTTTETNKLTRTRTFTVTVAAAKPLAIGDSYQGGIIAYIDGTGNHGLIAAPTDQSNGILWATANTLCNDLELNGYSDWRMPSKDELNWLFLNRVTIGHFVTSPKYWSSTMYGSNPEFYWIQYFDSGSQDMGMIYGSYSLRAVRSF